MGHFGVISVEASWPATTLSSSSILVLGAILVESKLEYLLSGEKVIFDCFEVSARDDLNALQTSIGRVRDDSCSKSSWPDSEV